MFKVLEKTFTVAMLFYTTGATLPYITARLNGQAGLGPSSIELIIQSVFYAGMFCFIAIRWRSVLNGACNAKWILALLMVAFISTTWSDDPAITLRRAIALCATTAFGVYFATQFDVDQQLQLLAWTCALVIIASFVFSIFLPRFGVDHVVHYGDWQGAFNQKNMLARAMVLATLVFLFVRFPSGLVFRWMGIAASITLLLLSRSVTGVIVFAIILASLPAYRLFRTGLSFAFPLSAVVLTVSAAIVAIVYSNLPPLLALIHRDEGLTGRLDLWNAVMLEISKRLWLGYGFDAFWQGMKGQSAIIFATVGWMPRYAHNGFLDLVLDLGLLGLIIFAIGYLIFWWRALVFMTIAPGRIALWLCTYLAFVLFYNLTEGPVLSQNNISWVLYVSTAVSLVLYLPSKAGATEESVVS